MVLFYVHKELNGTHQPLVFADNGNLLDRNINIIKKYMETVVDSSKEVGLEVTTEEISVCLCLISRMQDRI
jgi:hypothetical protein